MKKWMSLILALLLTVSLFAGCTQAADNGAQTPDESVQAAKVYTSDDLEEGIKSVTRYTAEDLLADDARMNEVVATCGGTELTNRMLQFYFWMEYLNTTNGMSSYGVDLSAFGLDTTQPLYEQNSLAEGMNWEQYFLQAALERFREQAAVAAKAKAEGFTLPQDVQDYLDSLPEDLETQASTYGFDSADAFVQDTFGPGATAAGYVDYITLFYYAGYYENDVYSALDYTMEEVSDYFDANAESFESAGISKDDDTATVNVRHILLQPEDADGDGTSTDEEKAAAKAEAEALLDEYLKNPTEENFAALANEHSTDPGSNTNGGLYEGVYPGQMVPTFNDWCFDKSRQTGDTGIVETDYGFHIMYYVSKSDTPYWVEYAAQNGYLTEKMDGLIKEMTEAEEISVQLERIVLGNAIHAEATEATEDAD